MMLYKYVVKNVAQASTARRPCFMPKPLFGDNGSGHAHPPELVEEGQALFAGKEYAGLVPDGAVLHRRAAEARPGAVRDLQSDDQQLQAAGARAMKRR